MAEVIVLIEALVEDDQGRAYRPQVCGRPGADGQWEGWIEFIPADGGTGLRSPRETEQSSRDNLTYWATGLTATYIEGALQRAVDAASPVATPEVPTPRAEFDGPAANPHASSTPAAPPAPPTPRPLLDPFHVRQQGEEVLRRELLALGPEHLRTIIRHHALVNDDAVPLGTMSQAGLAELIMAAVASASQ